jgi:hypothetical protein
VKTKIKLKYIEILVALALIYIFFYIPTSFIIYTPAYYNHQFNSQETYEILGENATIATQNLRNFFTYHEELNKKYWNEKEQLHMGDVRNLFMIMHGIAFICIIFLSIQRDKIKQSQKLVRILTGIILLAALLFVAFFDTTWNAIHPIFFSNDAWINYPEDISYYLFPSEFFVNALLWILITGLVLSRLLAIAVKMVRSQDPQQ